MRRETLFCRSSACSGVRACAHVHAACFESNSFGSLPRVSLVPSLAFSFVSRSRERRSCSLDDDDDDDDHARHALGSANRLISLMHFNHNMTCSLTHSLPFHRRLPSPDSLALTHSGHQSRREEESEKVGESESAVAGTRLPRLMTRREREGSE